MPFPKRLEVRANSPSIQYDSLQQRLASLCGRPALTAKLAGWFADDLAFVVDAWARSVQRKIMSHLCPSCGTLVPPTSTISENVPYVSLATHTCLRVPAVLNDERVMLLAIHWCSLCLAPPSLVVFVVVSSHAEAFLVLYRTVLFLGNEAKSKG